MDSLTDVRPSPVIRNLRSTTIIDLSIVIVLCLVVYLANGVTIGASDTVPTSLLAFNLLENHTLHLDAFQDAVIPSSPNLYFLIQAVNGHWTTWYPVGVAIVTFPLYCLFYLYLKLLHIPINLVDGSFDSYRLLFEKLAATLMTTLTVMGFYVASRLKFTRQTSLLATGVFAFATNTWMTGSQGLWQHGISNLMVVGILLGLLMANQAKDSSNKRSQSMWLLLTGVCAGLLPGIRPSSAVYMVAAIVYGIVIHRYQSRFLLLGLLSALPACIWNLYYFNSFVGGYVTAVKIYRFNVQQYIESFVGLMVSPSRGLFIFSPVVLFALLGLPSLLRLKHQRDEQLLICLGLATGVLLGSYSLYSVWWAGHCYGPRFMTDLLPFTCYLLNYWLSTPKQDNSSSQISTWMMTAGFCIMLVFSISVQAVGAFGYTIGSIATTTSSTNIWNDVPVDAELDRLRLWDFQDNPIRRHAAATFSRVMRPPIDTPAYQQGLRGEILYVSNAQGLLLDPVVTALPKTPVILSASVKNTGTSAWYGYGSAVGRGEVRVRLRCYQDADRTKLLKETRLYIPNRAGAGQTAIARGTLSIPSIPGRYWLSVDLVSEAVMDDFTDHGETIYELNVLNQFAR